MEALPGAVSFCRALLMLARTQATGVLELSAQIGRCRVALVRGVARAAKGDLGAVAPLGDRLLVEGDLDADAHVRALGGCLPGRQQPIGRWLVEHGLSTDGAVESALRRQLRQRLIAMCRSPGLDYRFEAGQADVGARWLREPEHPADLVLAIMRTLLGEWSAERAVRAIESHTLRLGSQGHALLRGAALWPEEQALRSLLADGTTLPEVVEVTAGSVRALRFVALLSLLGALDDSPARSAYGLLLRKRRELRQRVPARDLLEAAPNATAADARRALHRLAQQLHPDRFISHAPAAVVDVSHEVMGALTSAERSVRRET